MKHLLRFIYNLSLLRPKDIYFPKTIVCFSNNSKYKQLAVEKEDITWFIQLSKEQIKTLLFINSEYKGESPNDGTFFNIIYTLFFTVYNTAIRQITARTAIVLHACFHRSTARKYFLRPAIQAS